MRIFSISAVNAKFLVKKRKMVQTSWLMRRRRNKDPLQWRGDDDEDHRHVVSRVDAAVCVSERYPRLRGGVPG